MKIVIDLGGSHIAIGLVDDNLEIIEKRTYYMNDREAEKLEDYIVKTIKNIIKKLQHVHYYGGALLCLKRFLFL